MKQSKSSKSWLKEHFNDYYVKEAQKKGYRSRAVFKLIELQERDNFLKKGDSVVDLGAAPGGWSVQAREYVGIEGRIVGVDLLPIDPIAGVSFIQGDFREQEILEQLLDTLNGQPVDVVMSDMAPNMSGAKAIDIPKAMYLCELALSFAGQVLKPGGHLLMKVFHGEGFEALQKEVRGQFEKVVMRKPKSSRPKSREAYLLAKSHKVV